MLGADSVVSPYQPRFEVGEDTVNMNVLPFDLGDMLISSLGKSTVGHPSIGVDRASRHDIGLHELDEGLTGDILDHAEAYPSSILTLDLHGPRHDDLATRSTTAGTGLWASDVGLVGLHDAMEEFSPLLDHGSAEFMEHVECRFVVPDPHLAGELDGRHPRRHSSHKPSGLKPHPEGDFRAVHDGPCRHGGLESTLLALEEVSGSLPVVEIRPATGTLEPVRPAGLDQVLQASPFVREETLEGKTRFRVQGSCHFRHPRQKGHPASVFQLRNLDINPL